MSLYIMEWFLLCKHLLMGTFAGRCCSVFLLLYFSQNLFISLLFKRLTSSLMFCYHPILADLFFCLHSVICEEFQVLIFTRSYSLNCSDQRVTKILDVTFHVEESLRTDLSKHCQIRWASDKFPDFFRKIVVDTWKFSMLLLYILWDNWPIFMISGSNEHLLQELEYTL